MGSAYANKHDNDNAFLYLKKDCDLFEMISGEDSPESASTYNDLATIHVNKGEYEEALKLYAKSYKVIIKYLPKNHRDIKGLVKNISYCYGFSEKRLHESFEMWLSRLE